MSAAATAAVESLVDTDDLLAFLPNGRERAAALRVTAWLQANAEIAAGLSIADAKILTPVPHPNKLLLLAGNYAKHIEESGGIAVERARTFPYVFMKPPSTTLNRHGGEISLPAVSPDNIDWECELGVVIGKDAPRGVTEAEALDYVAGYTVVNDISDRGFRPEPESRGARSRQVFRLATRQMARWQLPRRPVHRVPGIHPRSAGAAAQAHRQRRGASGRQHRDADFPGGGGDRICVRLRHAGAGRHHFHRHRRRRGPRERRAPAIRATSSRPASMGLGC